MIHTQIDEVKEFWDRRPCNIRHSTKNVGTKAFFDEVDQRRYFVEPHIVSFAEFDRWKQKSVLEIGCGIGTDMIRFLQSGAKYVGTDLSPKSVSIASQRLKVYGFQASLFVGDCENIVLPSDSPICFDLIYSFGVLHHTPSITNALTAIRRLAAPSTEFRFMVYARNSWKNAMIRSGLDQPEAQHGCPIANTYDETQVEELLDKTGWSIESISQDHIFPWRVDKYINYEYVKEAHFEAMTPQLFDALKKTLGWHLMVKARPC